MNRLQRYTILAGLSLSLPLGIAAVAFARSTPPKAPVVASSPLGDTLPSVDLAKLDGTTISLRARLAGRPTLIFVTNVAECASCSNLALEIRIVGRDTPQFETVVIGSGSSVAAFRPYFEQMGLQASALVDEHRSLLTSLGVTTETLVLLADSTGRIVFVDARRPVKRTLYPISRLIRDMTAMLVVARPTRAH